MNIKTACPLDCWDTCSIIAHVEGGVVKDLVGDPDHPVTRGFLCNKGRRLKDRMYHPDRVLHPLKKVAGSWTRISWEQALREIADKIQHVLATHGHHAILHAYDWGSGTVLKNLNQRFFYLLGGCTETVGSLCWEAGLEAQRYDFGQARSHAPNDLTNASGIVVWGRNVSVTNIHMTPFLKKAISNGAKLCIVNPLPTDLHPRADLVIAPRPGTDGALALGVLKHCKDCGWLDETFLRQHAVGWAEFSAYLDQFTLDVVEQETDVPIEHIVRLAEFYGTTRPVATLLGLGMQRYPGGGNAIRAIDALVAATGHVGIPGGGVNYANRMMSEFLNDSALTARDGADVREFSRGQQADEILSANPPIELMFVTRTNPVTQVPDTARLLEAYKRIPCIVVVDMFMTKTAELADYFLPCTSVLEEEDFVYSTMWHNYVTYIHRVCEPRGEARPDWEIFAALADELGFGDKMRRPVEEWMSLALHPLREHGITLQELKQQGTIRVPTPDVPWSDYQFRTPSGKYEFVSETARAEGHSGHATYVKPREIGSHGARCEESGSGRARFPYPMLTIHPRVSENSQHRDAPNVPPIPTLEVSSAIAAERGLKQDALARVWNDQAELTVRVKIKAGGHPYTVKLESGWWGQGITVNHFTKRHKADFGDQTAQYDCTVNVEPMTAEE
jgi:anaerobic selenocysteine-containing dehydrogenase